MVFSMLTTSVALSALSALPLASASSHFIMGGLKPIVYERVDAIVSPGAVSGHLHAFMGANNINPNSNYDSLRTASCTSAPFQKVDLSSYWAPPPYYQDQQTKQLSLMPSSFNIYYFFDRNGPGEKVQAFPQGLRMVAGNPSRSTYNASNFADQAVSFVCLDYSGAVSNDPAYAERKDIHFPDINKCKDGIRYQIFFPQCWDGKNLDSADHKSHMAYPVDNYNGGSCPASHPVHTVAIFYEQIIPVSGYNYWGEGAYVLSTGDPDGLTYHADFMMGWDQAVLQDAVDNCHNMNGDINACQVLAPYINQQEASACTFAGSVVNEPVGNNGQKLSALPGCNPIRSDFSTPASCPASATPSFQSTTTPMLSGWTDAGCIVEGTNGRALTGASTTSPNMTLNVCAGFCGSKGFKYAGVEFGDECYCGNNFSNGATGKPTNQYECSTPCAGNPQYAKCGGPQRLELLVAGAAPAPASSPAAQTPSPAPVLSSAVPAKPSVSSTHSTASQVLVATPSSKPAAASATPSAPAGSSGNSSSGAVSTNPAPQQGTWSAAGCVQDGGARALTGYSFTSSSMTQELCQSTCGAKGFSIAGVEYGQECYCGNSFVNNLGQNIANAGAACYMSCAGNRGEHCGGTWTMNIFKLNKASKRAHHFGRHGAHAQSF